MGTFSFNLEGEGEEMEGEGVMASFSLWAVGESTHVSLSGGYVSEKFQASFFSSLLTYPKFPPSIFSGAEMKGGMKK